MRSLTIKSFYLCAFLIFFNAVPAMAQTQSQCQFISTEEKTCEKDLCKQTVVMRNCSRLLGAGRECKFSTTGSDYVLCCGDAVYNAYAGDRCGGPSEAQLQDLRTERKVVVARIFAPNCHGGFSPVSSYMGPRSEAL